MNFMSNNGVVNNGTPEAQVVDAWITLASTFGTLDTNPVVVRPVHPNGYRFLGWSMNAAAGSQIIAPDTNWSNALNLLLPQYRTVYAQWGPGPEIDPPYIAIGFYGNGGTPPRQVTLADIYPGAEFFGSLQTTITNPTRGNRIFHGWHTARTGGQELLAGRPVSYNDVRVFFARWDEHFLEFRFDGENSNPNTRAFDYIRIPVLLGEPIDWSLATGPTGAAYVYGIGNVISGPFDPNTNLPSTEGWAFWGWFDDDVLDYGLANRPPEPGGAAARRRPMVGSTGWNLSDPGFTFTQAQFDALGNGYVIRFTAIWSLWGDADDNDVVDPSDILLMDQWLFDNWYYSIMGYRYFDFPINLRAANVTTSGTVTPSDILRIDQWLFDQWLLSIPIDPYFEAVLGRP